MSPETVNPAAIFTTGDRLPMGAPWGDQGVMLKDAPNSTDALKQAGLDWPVELKPAGFLDWQGKFIENPEKKMVVRATDQHPLSVVGNKWKPIQNTTAFNFFDPFVESGQCEYHTAGYINNGERIFILAKIKADPFEVVKGDPIDSFFLLTNVHSAVSCGRVIFTNIRFVCTNLLPAMLKETKQQKIFHTGDIMKKVSEVQEVIDMRQRDFVTTMEDFKFLASREYKAKQLDVYLDRVLSGDKVKIVKGKVLKDEGESSHRNTKNRIEEIIETGYGTDIKGVRGSWWGAVNGVTEFLGHHKGRVLDNRVESVLYGDSKKKSKLAISIALEMAA